MLSLIEHLTIDFPSHFILSIIDVHRDTTTHNKLIFPLALMRLLRHFEVHFPSSNPFPIIGAINAGTVKRSEAQFLLRWSELIAIPTPSTPSTSALFTSVRGVTLAVIMAQLQRMDARLDTLSIELYQVNTCVGHIARWRC